MLRVPVHGFLARQKGITVKKIPGVLRQTGAMHVGFIGAVIKIRG
jgi:hypothetical protein